MEAKETPVTFLLASESQASLIEQKKFIEFFGTVSVEVKLALIECVLGLIMLCSKKCKFCLVHILESSLLTSIAFSMVLVVVTSYYVGYANCNLFAGF